MGKQESNPFLSALLGYRTVPSTCEIYHHRYPEAFLFQKGLQDSESYYLWVDYQVKVMADELLSAQ